MFPRNPISQRLKGYESVRVGIELGPSSEGRNRASALSNFMAWLKKKGFNFGRAEAAKIMDRNRIVAHELKPDGTRGGPVRIESQEIITKLPDGRTIIQEARDYETAFMPHRKNPALIHLIRLRDFRFSRNFKKGKSFMSLDGGTHYFNADLELHDLEQLAAYSLLEYCTVQYRNRIQNGAHVGPVLHIAKKPKIPMAIVRRMRQLQKILDDAIIENSIEDDPLKDDKQYSTRA